MRRRVASRSSGTAGASRCEPRNMATAEYRSTRPNTTAMIDGATMRREGGAAQRAECRRDLQEHADADIAEALPHVRRGSTRGGGDDRDERGSDGVADVDAERRASEEG